jgi:hypothetical protein
LVGTPAILTEGFGDFPQPPQANSGIVAVLGHNRFLANPFQFIIHASIRRCVDTDGVVKQHADKQLNFILLQISFRTSWNSGSILFQEHMTLCKRVWSEKKNAISVTCDVLYRHFALN